MQEKGTTGLNERARGPAAGRKGKGLPTSIKFGDFETSLTNLPPKPFNKLAACCSLLLLLLPFIWISSYFSAFLGQCVVRYSIFPAFVLPFFLVFTTIALNLQRITQMNFILFQLLRSKSVYDHVLSPKMSVWQHYESCVISYACAIAIIKTALLSSLYRLSICYPIISTNLTTCYNPHLSAQEGCNA